MNKLLISLALLLALPTASFAWNAAAANAEGEGISIRQGDTPKEAEAIALEGCRYGKIPGCKLIGPAVSGQIMVFFKGSTGFGYAANPDRQKAFDFAYEKCVKVSKNCKMSQVGWAGINRYGAVAKANDGAYYVSINVATEVGAEAAALANCKKSSPRSNCQVVKEMTTYKAMAYGAAYHPNDTSKGFLVASEKGGEHAKSDAVAFCNERMKSEVKCVAHDNVMVNAGYQWASKEDHAWMQALNKIRDEEDMSWRRIEPRLQPTSPSLPPSPPQQECKLVRAEDKINPHMAIFCN